MKTSLIVISIFFVSTYSFSQSGKSEVSLSYGFGTANQFIDEFIDAFRTGFGEYQIENKSYTGAICLGYNYNITSNIKLGAAFVFEGVNGDVIINDQNRGTQNNRYTTFLAGLNVSYISNVHFNLYSGVYGGLSNRNAETTIDSQLLKDSEQRFGFHLAAIGLRFGTNVGGFAEAGFGDMGLLRLGVSARF